MKSKKMLISFLLVFLVALSVSAISAADDSADIVAADDPVDVVAADDAVEEISADESADDVVAVATHTPATNDYNGINDAIQNETTSSGDTIDLSVFDTYDVGNKTIEVAKDNLIIKGNGNTIIQGWGGPGNGIFHVTATGVTFMGIKFVDNNPNSVLTYYDDETKDANEVKGWGIHFQGAKNGVVDNCTFVDFNHGVRIQAQANDVTVKNSKFTGVTNYLRNDPLVNVEKGTKAIGIMGSQRAQLINNTFEGPMLDAISIASGSGGCAIINNTFIGNSYAIYFGGASTDETIIKGNRFKAVGEFHGIDAKSLSPIDWTLLPIISIQKSSTGISIQNNTIEALNNNIIIAAEAGNTAHGGLSELGNIVVTGNTIVGNTTDVNTATVTLLHILSRIGDFNPNGPVTVSDNTLNGARPLVYWHTAWGNEYGDAEIPAGDLAVAFIVTDSSSSDSVSAILLDGDGVAVENAVIKYAINGVESGNFTLDDTGRFTINASAGDVISISYDGKTFTVTKDKKGNLVTTWTQTFKPISLNITLPGAAGPIATTLTASDISIKAGNSGNLVATLKDANGNLLAGQEVIVQIDGTTFAKAKTNDKGVISVAVKYSSATTKYAYLSFVDTSGKYIASLDSVKITVTKKATTLAASKATLKVKKAKKVKVTLKSEGKALSGKKVTIKVNGKTFSAKTNSKGVATISVKVAKKGKFNAKVSFAGDGAYNAVSKTVKFTVKK